MIHFEIWKKYGGILVAGAADNDKNNEVKPTDTVDERVAKAIEYFKSEVESVSLGNIESLTIKEIQSLRDSAVYDGICFYMEDWNKARYNFEELGKLAYLLHEKIESEYISAVL